jgi:hypothetical protein
MIPRIPKSIAFFQTLEDVTVYVTDSDDNKFEFNLESRGLPVRVPKDPSLLPVVEEVLGVKCQWVLAPKPPIEPQEAPSDDYDDSSPNEPMVTVEQSEESKRQGHVEDRNGFPIHCSPKPYHLTIHRPQSDQGWLAAHDKLFLGGPTYVSQYDVWKQMRAALVAPPLFEEGLDKPKTPDAHTCFDEFRRLMAQWVLKLSKDELEKLRKTIQKTSNPKYWEQLAKDLTGS